MSDLGPAAERQESRFPESENERRRFRDASHTQDKDRIEENDWSGASAIGEEPLFVAVVAEGVGGTNDETCRAVFLSAAYLN